VVLAGARPVVVRSAAGRRRQFGRRLAVSRLALLGLGILAPLLGLELGFRLAGPFLPGDYETASFVAPSAVVGRQNKPNMAGWRHTAEFTTWLRVNSKGLRGPEIEYVKTPGAFRILVLGDSFTFALQVAKEQTFVTRLADWLNAAQPGLSVETINAGVDGWSTANEYAWLATEGFRYEPDLVLLMYYVGNDPHENADQVGSPEEVDRLRLGADRGRPLDAARAALRGASVAYTFFEQGVLAKLSAQSPLDELQREQWLDGRERLQIARAMWGLGVEPEVWDIDSEQKVRGWAISEALLGRLRDFCSAREMKLAVVGIPTNVQVTKPQPTTTPLPVVSRRAGLPEIDLLEPFRAQQPGLARRLYFPENRHWTPDGHDLAAQVVATELVQRGLVRVPGS
jgi:hypothetical protein